MFDRKSWFIIFLLTVSHLSSVNAQPLSQEGLLKKALSLFEFNEVQQSLEYLNRYLEKDPNHRKALLTKARCLEQLNQYVESIEVLDIILKTHPNDRDVLLAKGLNLAKLGRYQDAVNVFQRIVKQYPDDYFTNYNLGVALRELNESDKAVERFLNVKAMMNEQNIEDEDMDFLLPYQMGLAYSSKQDYRKAIPQFFTALRKRPWHEKPNYQLGMALARIGDVTTSRKFMERFQKIEQANKKIAHFQQMASDLPESATPFFAAGQIQYNLGNLSEAEMSFRRAIQRDPEFADAYVILGVTYVKMKSPEKARQTFQNMNKRMGGNAVALHNLGILESKLNNLDLAQHYFEEALKVDPTYKPAETELKKLKTRRNEGG